MNLVFIFKFRQKKTFIKNNFKMLLKIMHFGFFNILKIFKKVIKLFNLINKIFGAIRLCIMLAWAEKINA